MFKVPLVANNVLKRRAAKETRSSDGRKDKNNLLSKTEGNIQSSPRRSTNKPDSVQTKNSRKEILGAYCTEDSSEFRPQKLKGYSKEMRQERFRRGGRINSKQKSMKMEPRQEERSQPQHYPLQKSL